MLSFSSGPRVVSPSLRVRIRRPVDFTRTQLAHPFPPSNKTRVSYCLSGRTCGAKGVIAQMNENPSSRQANFGGADINDDAGAASDVHFEQAGYTTVHVDDSKSNEIARGQVLCGDPPVNCTEGFRAVIAAGLAAKSAAVKKSCRQGCADPENQAARCAEFLNLTPLNS